MCCFPLPSKARSGPGVKGKDGIEDPKFSIKMFIFQKIAYLGS